VKREILQPDVPILAVPDIQVLNQGDGHFAPQFDHAREKIGIVQIERPVKTHRKRDRTIRVTDFQFSQMCVRQRGGELMEAQSLQVNPIEKQEIGKLCAINGAQAVKLEDAGYGVRILDLRKPRIGNLEFRIMLSACYLLAEFRDVARGYAQS